MNSIDISDAAKLVADASFECGQLAAIVRVIVDGLDGSKRFPADALCGVITLARTIGDHLDTVEELLINTKV